jgi:hypothetical protein
MKTEKSKKESKKFDLEKFNVAKLKNLKSINGGKAPGDETVTDSLNGSDRKD